MEDKRYWLISYKKRMVLKDRKNWKKAKGEPDNFVVLGAYNSYAQAEKMARKFKKKRPKNNPVKFYSPWFTENPEVKWSCPEGNHYVYALYSSDDKILYIGVTSNPKLRAEQHFKKRFHHMEVLFSFDNRLEAEAFERFSIFHINPPLNVLILDEDVQTCFNMSDLDCFGSISDRRPKKKMSQLPSLARKKT